MASSAAALALLLAIAAVPAAAAQKRVLVVSEARGFVHESIPQVVAFFERQGRRSSRYEVAHLGGAARLTPARLRRAHAVVFATTTGELPLPDRAALLRFVRSGGAFIGVHSASDTFHGWPGYFRLLGAEFARHGRQQEGRVVVSARPHRVTRGLPRSFPLFEEFYEFRARPLPGSRVLVRLDPTSIDDEGGPDLPLAWTRRYGRGRVFYDALGHFDATWRHPLHSRLVRSGLTWALRL
jgi:type 1 glutamine amidotransferase